MAELKTKPTGESVYDFLNRIPDESRKADCMTLLQLMHAATGAEPVMWGASIVGFGRYAYRYESGRSGEWPVIGFSPRKNDLTLYIMPGFDRYTKLLEKLGKHKTGKSCLYIKRLSDLDRQILRTLIEESVKAMAPKRVDV